MSREFKITAWLCAFVLLCATLLLVGARADEWNKKTKLTFAEPVEVPGAVLPAGSYVFKLMDSTANRNIVQIWNEDETKLLATIIAIPNERLQPTDKTVITFTERPSGSPEALQAWFYPGDSFGWEFAYPKARAAEIAKANNQSVLAVDSTSSDVTSLKSARVSKVTPEGQEGEANAAGSQPQSTSASPPPTTTFGTATTTTQPNYAESERQQRENQRSQTTAAGTDTTSQAGTTNRSQQENLPKTASPLELIGLVGFLSLSVALALHITRRHIA